MFKGALVWPRMYVNLFDSGIQRRWGPNSVPDKTNRPIAITTAFMRIFKRPKLAFPNYA